MIEIELEGHRIEAGGEVVGRVRIGGDGALQKATSIKVVCRVRLDGSGTGEVIEHARVELQPPFRIGAEHPFTLRLPKSAPVTWEGRHVKVSWEVHATADIPWAIDPKQTIHFEVVPRRVQRWGMLTG